MYESNKIGPNARPTTKETRLTIGLGRWAMRHYTEGADATSRLHPSDVLDIAVRAYADGRRLKRLPDDVSAWLLSYANRHDAPSVPAVTQSITTFFTGRTSPGTLGENTNIPTRRHPDLIGVSQEQTGDLIQGAQTITADAARTKWQKANDMIGHWLESMGKPFAEALANTDTIRNRTSGTRPHFEEQ